MSKNINQPNTLATMPNNLKSETVFNTAVSTYRKEIKKEPYQPLQSLLNTISSKCTSNSIQFLKQ